MLSAYRVIDLTDEHGILCGQMLADLGAEVIQIEPPGGSSARRVGPFSKDEADPEGSLFFWAYARNKKSLVLDLDSGAGRDQLRRLIAGADFFVESQPPGRLAELGLGYEALSAENPGLVHVSITPFGSTGPKAGWAATDLTVGAAGGTVFLSGEGDRPPVRVCVPQAHAHGGADAAVGALIAHAERRRTGRGQHVDVSLQQSITLATMFRSLDAPLAEAPARRIAGGVNVAGLFIPTRYPLRDGWVILGPAFLPSTGHFMGRLLDWAGEHGFRDERLDGEEWGQFALHLIGGQRTAEHFDPLNALLSGFFAERTKAEIMSAAVERRLLLAPVLDIDEVVESEQLAERGFPTRVEHADGTSVRYPGPFARFSETPLRYRLPPPRLDAHGGELRAEPQRTPALARPSSGTETASRPLEGVKILDLFWVLAGPGSTRMLADYGATVVHVESMKRVDTLRVIPPYQFNAPHPEGSGAFQCANANKLGLTLDLASEESREIVLDLVRWADVVTESFAPGVISQYGLDWETLRKVKPELIMISSCLMGQSGPWRDFTGFGNLAASVTAFQQLASWPGRPPAGPYGAYTDFIAVRYNAAAILAALEHRDRTGRGQYIDMSQGEAALHFAAPAFLDYTVNGRVSQAVGNADPDLFPHDVFAAAGEDRWVAIAGRHAEDRRALCELVGRPELAASLEDSEQARSALLDSLRSWTADRDAAECEAELQARGVPAHVVLETPALFEDPQLQERGHYVEIGHDIYPTTTIESSRLVMSRSQARVPEKALSFGRDNRQVLEQILGYSPARIAELASRGVLI